MMVTGICVVGVLLLTILNHENLNGILTSFSIATVLFIPAAIIVKKYRLYSPAERKYNLSSLLFTIIFGIVLVIAPRFGSTTREVIGMFGFEMSTLLYVLVLRLEKAPS